MKKLKQQLQTGVQPYTIIGTEDQILQLILKPFQEIKFHPDDMIYCSNMLKETNNAPVQFYTFLKSVPRKMSTFKNESLQIGYAAIKGKTGKILVLNSSLQEDIMIPQDCIIAQDNRLLLEKEKIELPKGLEKQLPFSGFVCLKKDSALMPSLVFLQSSSKISKDFILIFAGILLEKQLGEGEQIIIDSQYLFGYSKSIKILLTKNSDAPIFIKSRRKPKQMLTFHGPGKIYLLLINFNQDLFTSKIKENYWKPENLIRFKILAGQNQSLELF